MSLRVSSIGLTVLGLIACGETGQSTTAELEGSGPGPSAAARTTAPMPSETRTFGNWTAVCDNGNNCAAYATAEASGSGWVLVRYPVGPEGQVEVKVGDWSDSPVPLSLSIDGQALKAFMSSRSDSSDGTIIDRFDDQTDVIARLGQGRTLVVTGPDSAPTISLQGAAAAFLWIDERQGRLGTTTALIRRGERAASSVRGAPDLPIVSAAAAASQAGLSDDPVLPASLETLPAVRACRADLDLGNGREPPKDDGVARLSDDTLLWSVLCFQGAYNTGHRFFLTGNDGQNPRPLLLRSSDQQDRTAGVDDDYILINAGYDPESRTLSSFGKGRGLADCGAAHVWTWTGREFVLTEEQVMLRCAGMTADLWPTTWRSKEA